VTLINKRGLLRQDKPLTYAFYTSEFNPTKKASTQRLANVGTAANLFWMAEALIFPVHPDPNHWCMFSVTRHFGQIKAYDSMVHGPDYYADSVKVSRFKTLPID